MIYVQRTRFRSVLCRHNVQNFSLCLHNVLYISYTLVYTLQHTVCICCVGSVQCVEHGRSVPHPRLQHQPVGQLPAGQGQFADLLRARRVPAPTRPQRSETVHKYTCLYTVLQLQSDTALLSNVLEFRLLGINWLVYYSVLI